MDHEIQDRDNTVLVKDFAGHTTDGDDKNNEDGMQDSVMGNDSPDARPVSPKQEQTPMENSPPPQQSNPAGEASLLAERQRIEASFRETQRQQNNTQYATAAFQNPNAPRAEVTIAGSTTIRPIARPRTRRVSSSGTLDGDRSANDSNRGNGFQNDIDTAAGPDRNAMWDLWSAPPAGNGYTGTGTRNADQRPEAKRRKLE